MKSELSVDDIDFLLTSLNHTKLNFESTEYLTYDLKKEQLNKIEEIKIKLRKFQDNLCD